MNLTYFGKLMAADGYGRAVDLHLGSLLKNGANMFVQPTGDWSSLDTNPEVFQLIHRPRRPTRWGVLHYWPPTDWGIGDCRWHLGYSMIEGTRAPGWYCEAVNRWVVALLTPSQFCANALRESGVHRPIHVVPHGLDDAYYPGELAFNDSVTFGTLGTLTPRKGTDILLRCFQRAFAQEQDVRLEIKCRGAIDEGFQRAAQRDRRISIFSGEWSVAQNCRWYQGLTAYVSATRGEGFGLTICEAMRCGCPVIATNWSGCAEYLRQDLSYPLAIAGLRPTLDDWPEGPDFGEWAVPDEEHLISLLRGVYEDPASARVRGRAAADFIAKRFPHRLPGELTLDILRSYGVE